MYSALSGPADRILRYIKTTFTFTFISRDAHEITLDTWNNSNAIDALTLRNIHMNNAHETCRMLA